MFNMFADLAINMNPFRSDLRAAESEAKQSISAIENAGRQSSGVFSSLGNSFKSMFSGVGDTVKSVFGGVVLGAGIGIFNQIASAGSAAFGALKGAAIDTNAALQDSATAWATMLGSTQKAQDQLKMLQQFANTTPFDFQQVDQAAHMMATFGIATQDTQKYLKLFGDAAAGTNNSMSETTFWSSRLYDALQSGKPIGEAAMRLQEMGVLSGTTATKLEQMQAQGAKGADIWNVYAGSIDKFNGLMDKQSKNWTGQLSTMQDALRTLTATAFLPLFNALTNGMGRLNDFLASDRVNNWINFFSNILGKGIDLGVQKLTSFAHSMIGIGTAVSDAISAFRNGQTTLAQFIGGFEKLFGTLLGGASGAASGVGGAVGGIFSSIADAIGKYGPQIADQLGIWAHAFVDWIGDDAIPWLGPKLQDFLGAIGSWTTRVGLPWVVQQMTFVGQLFGGLAVRGWSWVTSVAVPFLVQNLPLWLAAIRDWITKTAIPDVTSSVGGVATAFGGWVVDAVRNVPAILGQWKDAITNWIEKTAIPDVEAAAAKVGDTLGGWLGSAATTVTTNLPLWRDAITSWITDTAIPTVKDRIGAFATLFGDWVNDATVYAKTNIPLWADAISAWITGTAIPAVKDRLSQFATIFGDWVNDATVYVKTNLPLWSDAISGHITNVAGPHLKEVSDQTLPNSLNSGFGGATVDSQQHMLTWSETIQDRLDKLPGEIDAALAPSERELSAWIGRALPGTALALANWVPAITTVLANLPAAMAALTAVMGKKLWDWVDPMDNPTVEAFGRWNIAILGFLKGMERDIFLAAQRIGEGLIGGMAQSIEQGIATTLTRALNSGIDALNNFGGQIAQGLNMIAGMFKLGTPFSFPRIGYVGSGGGQPLVPVPTGPQQNGGGEQGASQLASGTNNWGGGWAWVGEGHGGSGAEYAYLPAGAKVIPHAQSMALAAAGSIPMYRGFADGLNVGDIVGLIGQGASGIVSSVLSSVGVTAPNIGGGALAGTGDALLGMVKDWLVQMVQGLLGGLHLPGGGGGGGGGGAPVSGSVVDWLNAAIALTGVPASWLGGLEIIASNESGGNPNAENDWDTNAAAGDPSRGLMQTIGSTFNAYALPGHGDIWNPVDNAAAAIRYILEVYGDISNVPGVASVNSGGPYLPYANGGMINEEIVGIGLTSGTRYRFGEHGPEAVIPMGAGGDYWPGATDSVGAMGQAAGMITSIASALASVSGISGMASAVKGALGGVAAMGSLAATVNQGFGALSMGNDPVKAWGLNGVLPGALNFPYDPSGGDWGVAGGFTGLLAAQGKAGARASASGGSGGSSSASAAGFRFAADGSLLVTVVGSMVGGGGTAGGAAGTATRSGDLGQQGADWGIGGGIGALASGMDPVKSWGLNGVIPGALNFPYNPAGGEGWDLGGAYSWLGPYGPVNAGVSALASRGYGGVNGGLLPFGPWGDTLGGVGGVGGSYPGVAAGYGGVAGGASGSTLGDDTGGGPPHVAIDLTLKQYWPDGTYMVNTILADDFAHQQLADGTLQLGADLVNQDPSNKG